MEKMATSLPRLVARLTHYHEAWIVGSAADPANKTPRDYDILIPLSKWQDAAGLIPEDAVSNSFGGFKCIVEEGIEVDIWPGELSWIMQRPQSQYAWQPKTGIRLMKILEP